MCRFNKANHSMESKNNTRSNEGTMLEVSGDIWGYPATAVIAITTNGSLTRDGRAVLGRGCARQAAERFPGLQQRLGSLMTLNGNHVQLIRPGLVSFPVEESAWSLPDLQLIARSAEELRSLADRKGWEQIIVPRPGCGGGGLSWRDVAPLLAAHFDDRFLVIDR
jgi:hypothetical protein